MKNRICLLIIITIIFTGCSKKVKLENIKLSRDIRRLKSDKEYLADIIRKKMHYSKKNEIVYIFTTTTREDSPAKRVNMLGTGEQR